ncbi:hypothetical protein HYPSUDRAFT_42077 [Hypholoma sublateritium FD-334 SS-4]|uniref:Uncharacterized protein n=1 Tax=Hypholoma sublateritium (strain FD-334 SS-4) TaxID=945553 RepID=A0A0D2L3Q4_HYPSF|nr:hypothetical protein HYPSUDRAFT_42077 [Hypholoma sublateritium FD-334 SS-4]
MVSVRTTKVAKASYADRVLGAFSQLQREHKKHAIHPAALRAQVKKDAQEKKDKLGPNWSHWVGRALTKMGEEGILEPATPKGSVALTSKGKKAIDYARRAVRQSIGASPGRNEPGPLWKQVVSYSASGTKRPRKSTNYAGEDSEDSDAYRTPSKRKSPTKRARLSIKTPGKKLIAKMTKAELRAELNTLQKKDVLRTFEKEMSPLTDLESDDDDVTTHLREEIRERDEEIENMRRELSAARKRASADTGRLEDEIRFPTTPQMNSRTFAQPSSTPAVNSGALLTRKGMGGIVRTESGSHIPNISRRPTPAPSSPDADMEYDERGFTNDTSGGDFHPSLDTTSHDNGGVLINSAETRATQNGEQSLSGRLETAGSEARFNLQHRLELENRDARIAALTDEIGDLQRRVAEDALLVGSKAAEIAELEKSVSDRVSALEALVSERDEVIDSLGNQNRTYEAELAALRDSWKRADEMVTTTAERLATAEALVVELQAQRESEVRKVDNLTKSSEQLLRSKDSMQTELDRLRTKYTEIEEVNGALLIEKRNAMNEAETLRGEVDRLNVTVNEQAQALAQATADAQVMRGKNSELEFSITRHEAEAIEKQHYSQKLLDELNSSERSYAQIVAELATVKTSADEKSTELDSLKDKISTLEEGLERAGNERESLKSFLAKTTEDLKSEEAKRRRLEEEISDKERDLNIAQGDAQKARLLNDTLVAEKAAKDDSINRLSDEKSSVEGLLLVAETCVDDLRKKLETDRIDSSRAISALEVSLASAISDNTATREEVHRLLEEKEGLQASLSSANSLVKDLDRRVEVERTEKSAANADLLTAEARALERQEELNKLKEAKKYDEQTIFTLKDLFKNLRDSQSKAFADFEAQVDAASPFTNSPA